MATWLVFPDQATAQAAVAAIDDSKNFPVSPDAVTQTWAIPRALADGTYAIPKCRDADLAGVTGYTATDAAQWPPQQPLGKS